jgi:serine protease Do
MPEIPMPRCKECELIRRPARARALKRPALLAAAIATALLTACGGDKTDLTVTTAGAQTAPQQAERARRVTGRLTDTVSESRRTAIVTATERVSSSVVSINVTSRRQVRSQSPSPWDFFFVPETERVVQGYGTGFVLRADGIILTNQHVVAGADRVVVTLPDGSDAPAKVLGEDPLTDIAVVKVDRGGLHPVTVGHSNDLMIGEWVVALGNPYAYMLGNSEPTVTVGVVSATGRNILPNGEQTGLYLDMIQTDAAINPGNSGGPLTNALGEVVGVNSSIFSNTGGSVGLGFAIPIERAVRVADEIVRTGSVRRAWVGLEIEGARAMRESKGAGGVTVVTVAPGGPAARAGIQVGDVLIEANGRRLRNFLNWEAVKLDSHVGDAVDVTVRSGKREARKRIVTGDLPTVAAEKVTVLRDLQLVTVTPAIQVERGLRSGQGALIYQLTVDVSRATGLRAGDVIVAVNRARVRSAAQVSELLDVKPGEVVRLYLERDGQLTYTDLVFR